VLVRIAYGTRVSLLGGVLASALAVLIGAIVADRRLHGGAIDTLLSRFMDVVLSLPFLGLAWRWRHSSARLGVSGLPDRVLQLGVGGRIISRRGPRGPRTRVRGRPARAIARAARASVRRVAPRS